MLFGMPCDQMEGEIDLDFDSVGRVATANGFMWWEKIWLNQICRPKSSALSIIQVNQGPGWMAGEKLLSNNPGNALHRTMFLGQF
jgi:hypothetical protein